MPNPPPPIEEGIVVDSYEDGRMTMAMSIENPDRLQATLMRLTTLSGGLLHAVNNLLKVDPEDDMKSMAALMKVILRRDQLATLLTYEEIPEDV